MNKQTHSMSTDTEIVLYEPTSYEEELWCKYTDYTELRRDIYYLRQAVSRQQVSIDHNTFKIKGLNEKINKKKKKPSCVIL